MTQNNNRADPNPQYLTDATHEKLYAIELGILMGIPTGVAYALGFEEIAVTFIFILLGLVFGAATVQKAPPLPDVVNGAAAEGDYARENYPTVAFSIVVKRPRFFLAAFFLAGGGGLFVGLIINSVVNDGSTVRDAIDGVIGIHTPTTSDPTATRVR